MIEFVDGPCGWNCVAPTRLRRQAYGGVSAWRDYSTAGFLDGSSPIILRTVNFPDFEFDSGLQIELLPEALVSRWQKVGLQFATEADMNDVGIPDVLVRSLDLVHMVRPLLGTVAALCRSLHMLLASNMDFDSSYTDPSLPFSIFVSCPLPMELNRVERLAENIMHETLHLQLSLVETAEPLAIGTLAERCVFSPWRHERRTLRGLVHSVYVFGNIRFFWNYIGKHLPDYSTFAERRIEKIDGELADARGLETNPALTSMGRRLVTSLLTSP